MNLTMSPRYVGATLISVIVALSVASAAGQVCKHVLGHGLVFGLVPLLYVGNERNIPTWYSSATLLLCALLLAVIGAAKKREADRWTRHWRGLATVFLFLSIDEAASIHEPVARWLRGSYHFAGILYPAWVIPWGALTVGLLVAYVPFLAAIPVKTRRLFLLAGGLYLAGALVLEMAAGPAREAMRSGTASIRRQSQLTLVWLESIEELLEMLGVAAFIYALLSYIGKYMHEVCVRVRDGGEAPRAP